MRAKLKRLFVLTGLLAFLHSAQADIWGYVDDKGVTHFATEKVDTRYEVFYRSGQSFEVGKGQSAKSSGLGLSKAAPDKGGAATGVGLKPHKLLTFFEVSPSYKGVQRHLREASKTHKIDYELLKALIATESGFDTNAVSPKGAVGLMQLMPSTAERFGVSADAKTTIEQKLVDPKVNIKAGSRYFQYLMKLFPDQLELSIAAYNAGEGAVKRAGNKIPNYKETQNYVKTVMALYSALKPEMGLLVGGSTGNAVGLGSVKTSASANANGRVRMEIINGGAKGRGNLPAAATSAPAPALSLPVDTGQSRNITAAPTPVSFVAPVHAAPAATVATAAAQELN